MAPFNAGAPITCHSWNADASEIALCPNNNEIHIYKVDASGKFERTHVLAEHDQLVSSIHWGHKTNRLVSCSHDRNAYVWNLVDGVWKPTLVILRINRAATSVQWSPDETKFAVSCGAKCVPVCYFEEDNDWWVSKIIKKHKSTVLSVDWHPCNTVIATGSSDFRCRIFSAQIKSVDGKKPSPWGEKLTFGDLLHTFDQSRGWVHDVKWSPSGAFLAFSGHDSTLSVARVGESVERAGEGMCALTAETIKTRDLPYQTLIFVSDNSLIAAGHDCNPKLFTFDGSKWSFIENVDKEKGEEKKTGGVTNALKMFQNRATMGEGQDKSAFTLKTLHQNCITQISAKSSAPVTKFSTSGLDGKLVSWDLNSISELMANLKL